MSAQAMVESARALQYLERLWAHKPKRENTERKRQNTWKSYMLQEAEAASREAKLSWCWQNEVRVVSLQPMECRWRLLEKRTWSASQRALQRRPLQRADTR